MKIDAIDFSKEFQQELRNYTGLQDIKMRSLGKRVVIAGANGAGKSRLFNLLDVSRQNRRDLEREQINYEEINKDVKELHQYLKDNWQLEDKSEDNFRQLEQELDRKTNELRNCIEIQKLFEVIKTDKNSVVNIVRYHTKNLEIQSANNQGLDSLIQNTEGLKKIGVDGVGNSPSYLQYVFQISNNASISNAVASEVEIQNAHNTKQSLVDLLRTMLGKEANPTFKIEGFVTLFGHKDYETKLSEGQKILFQLACVLHAQDVKLNEAIIFFDEPENHLHPSALIDLIDKLDELTKDGQLWIATHSVPLIAHMVQKDSNCLWYMDNGKIEHAGRKPEKVLHGLMGVANGVQALQDFTVLPSQLAINRFLAECLLPPTTVAAISGDPQTKQITDKIQQLRTGLKSEEKLRVLDYGAGKGRLLDALQAIDTTTDLSSWLDYRAYDPFDDDKKVCIETICRTYDSADQRYFNLLNGTDSLMSKTDEGSYDLIVMCNVLHEIDPDKWFDCFGDTEKSFMTQLLKPTGGLLVVEDYQIPTGELAHKYGFLLLDEQELKELFDIKEQNRTSGQFIRSSCQENYKDRLVMHWIAQPLLKQATHKTRINAIKKLKENTDSKISDLQSTAKERVHNDFSNGHKLALASQTYTNAARWLEKNEPKQFQNKL